MFFFFHRWKGKVVNKQDSKVKLVEEGNAQKKSNKVLTLWKVSIQWLKHAKFWTDLSQQAFLSLLLFAFLINRLHDLYENT